MSEKPEALRLADALKHRHGVESFEGDAAAELRRLHADNERLREELRQSSIDHTRAEVERLKAERDEAVRAEREACAKVCEGMARPVGDDMMSTAQWIATSCAAAIRARGQEPPR